MGLLFVQQPGHVYAAEMISISDAEVTVAEGEYRYIASEIRPQVTVTLKGSTLKEGTDYDVFFSNNVTPGRLRSQWRVKETMRVTQLEHF